MIRKILLISLFAILSCSIPDSQSKEAASEQKDTTTLISKPIERIKYHLKQDSLFIPSVFGDTLRYGKEDFNTIVDYFPELTDDITTEPDETYFRSGIWKDIIKSDGTKEHLTFGSENGRDEFYVLYSWFLKSKNGEEKFKERREKLIQIYSAINNFSSYLESGGTYFGHMQKRILAYAEYSVCLFSDYKEYFIKSYDISKQREIFIKSLRQQILDESSINLDFQGEKKIERDVELNKIVDSIEKFISDYFYLKQAQEFLYRYY